jgi:hypothetical protein
MQTVKKEERKLKEGSKKGRILKDGRRKDIERRKEER